MNDSKMKHVLFRMLIYWFVYPLFGGIVGMVLAFIFPDAIVNPNGSSLPEGAAELIAFTGIGLAVGSVVAAIHTVCTYWKASR